MNGEKLRPQLKFKVSQLNNNLDAFSAYFYNDGQWSENHEIKLFLNSLDEALFKEEITLIRNFFGIFKQNENDYNYSYIPKSGEMKFVGDTDVNFKTSKNLEFSFYE